MIYSPERALLPMVLAICSTSILEMVIENRLYHWSSIVVTLVITIAISIICLDDKNAPIHLNFKNRQV